MYTLYGFPKTRSVRVAWALEEMGLPYDYKLVDLKSGAHLQPEYLALTPSAKIPLLITPDGTLSESAAIVTYLADKHGSQEFIPLAGSYERGVYEQMMCFFIAELEQPLWTMAKHTFALPEAQRVDAIKPTAVWEFQRALNVFSQMLGDKDYATGNMFTMADVVGAHILSWAKGGGIDLTYDNVKAYADRVLARPAYKQAWQKESSYLPA